MSDPIVAPEITYDGTTDVVTEKFADGTEKKSTLSEFLAAQVASGRAHNENEARVQIGLPQIASDPAAPDGTGNPSFTVPATPVPQPLASVPSVAIPAAPPPNAPPVHHANWLHSLFVALEAAGAVVGSPAVVACLPPKYQAYAAAIGAVGSVVAGTSNASPASLGLT